MSNQNLRASTLVITLASLMGMVFATPAHAEQRAAPALEAAEQPSSELDEQVCVDASAASETAPEAQFGPGPGALICELQCHREYNCAGQGAWCWDALSACIDECHN